MPAAGSAPLRRWFLLDQPSRSLTAALEPELIATSDLIRITARVP